MNIPGIDASATRHSILVGVQVGLPDAVLWEAARLAADLRTELVCAHVDLSRYTVTENRDGSVLSRPLDPDLLDDGEGEFDEELAAHIDAVLVGSGVAWTGRELAGDPARALAHLADTVNARMIVVGTRDSTLYETVREFFQGSVATHLAHRQHRPVLVVPLDPVDGDGALPWEARPDER